MAHNLETWCLNYYTSTQNVDRDLDPERIFEKVNFERSLTTTKA